MITSCYIELRKQSARGTDSLIADVMRHLNTRQHLGKAVVVCEQPAVVLSAARKQWLKLSRSLQKQRSSTLNADKILKYTHTITRMQRMHFTIKTPLERPNGEVYFLSPDALATIPIHCWTVYVLCSVDPATMPDMLEQLPSDALVVDYMHTATWKELGLQPKKMLEARVEHEWSRSQHFLGKYNINAARLIVDGLHDPEAMDDALDTLLGGHSHEFLEMANAFQRALELARPLRLKKEVRYAYDSLILLAHRVQALRPGAYSHHFLESYNEDDTFFLYDPGRVKKHLMGAETLDEAYTRHQTAGRHHLANTLKVLAEQKHLHDD